MSDISSFFVECSRTYVRLCFSSIGPKSVRTGEYLSQKEYMLLNISLVDSSIEMSAELKFSLDGLITQSCTAFIARSVLDFMV